MRSNSEQIPDDSHNYILFKLLNEQPDLSQRDLAAKTGLSLGKVNYCLRALMDKGYIKAVNFKNSRKKAAYLYKITPRGIEEKARVTVRFLKYKMSEYDRVKAEIEELRRECQKFFCKEKMGS
jgi:EPS-associated MarR family transcriptional regulator